MYVKSKKYVGLYIKEKKSGIAFYTRLWYPPTKNSRYIKLGDKTVIFDEKEAFEKIIFIKENFKNKNYDYLTFNKNYGEKIEKKKDLSLNEVAEIYFNSITQRMKSDFLDKYKDRFEIEKEADLLNNQVYKNKLKAHKRMRAYYENHFKVKEFILEKQYTKREKIAKKKLVKVGIKTLNKIPEKKINDITLDDILTLINSIKNNMNISQKTKHNISSLLKTIFIFGKRYKYLKYNHFEDIDNKLITKNPHNFRKRILNVEEMEELFKELYKYDFMYNKPNIFRASLLGLSTGARANSILNLKKSDFKLKENMTQQNFIDAYYSIEIINFKTQDKYELPLCEEVGRYFYYVLKDYEEEEYIIRHSQIGRREIKPFSEMPKEFLWCCKRTVNATDMIKELYKWVDEDELRIDQLKEVSHVIDIKEKVKKHQEQIKKNLKTIDIEHKKKYKSHEEYLARNFSFHGFRHQLVSLASVINPLYAKRILNHSSDRKDATTDKYIKTELPNVKIVLETALKPYLNFLERIVKREQEKRKTNRLNEKKNFSSNIIHNNFSTTMEATRINKNTIPLYDYESVLFNILEDISLSAEERDKAIKNFDLYEEFDEKYLEE